MTDNAATHRSLDLLNFFLADVRDGLGPYLAIYLLTVQHWNEADIGLVMTLAGLAGIAAQVPAGALVDGTRYKRAVIIVAALLVTVGSLALPWLNGFTVVAILQSAVGAAGAVFPPAIAAVTLGLLGPRAFVRRVGRNESFNHAGNAVAALLAGGAAYAFGPVAVFWLMTAMALCSIAATTGIPADAIDHAVARGLHASAQGGGREAPSGLRVILSCRPLLIFGGCAALFHFANAAMLPLVGQKLAMKDPALGTSLMSFCIVAAQLVMVPMAMLVGARADRWGRKPLLLAAFLVLPLRGILYTLSDHSGWLVGVQLLDGVGAGLFGALFPLVVADLTEGTGRFNVSQGAIATLQGIGASLSTAAAGQMVVREGYSAAFLMLAGAAGVALLLAGLLLPETRGVATTEADKDEAAVRASTAKAASEA
ncbi:MFS family permease [Azospirillum lipoferum]|uniref:MFS transporter n=1 Tax=Azospirillum lipoferum TaxID=193 RepID=A0A5A9GRX8_AZOLI|nr:MULTISPECIES: MFS transporter [Azospirillum]KAA0597113.1 MFS transporter [Azospirillum lipoferum]MCP1608609.1 MFS family permease [Azospirillum lipoferum]MDW5536073.1 MFS transporter [Azospirillum sp. NL1]